MSINALLYQIVTIIFVITTFLFWIWAAFRLMRHVPAITNKLGLGETPGIILAVFALWPLFSLTYQLFRFFLPS
ncbi:hypothetical protein [Desulforamulus aquiferis]|uniref:Uncharacterized protein n=1 Tax=Desulforamulus aquiferis TaxID=1397668 RepID=A0AAW7Z9X7_9FIRM|nr:hypothetical protein [Desulforamulus aquiferis]MDO7785655.1 hypothetical protein [Desulforamulus aquiferis]RYD03247.1 hypothetical protein N752_20665 [Desulforamulus aquiferis]